MKDKLEWSAEAPHRVPQTENMKPLVGFRRTWDGTVNGGAGA